MSQVKGENQGMLRGEVLAAPKLSHHNHGVDYYLVPFRVPRLSGAEDVVNLVVSQPQRELWQPGNWLEVGGEVRSYNNRSGQGSRLVITMLVREVLQAHCREGENHLLLAGALCKPPVYRATPFGREICDLMLAVNRAFGKSDYIPCIAWGRNAQYAARFRVGDRLRVTGRLQSREYQKLLDNGEYMVRSALEVSCFTLEAEQAPSGKIALKPAPALKSTAVKEEMEHSGSNATP